MGTADFYSDYTLLPDECGKSVGNRICSRPLDNTVKLPRQRKRQWKYNDGMMDKIQRENQFS